MDGIVNPMEFENIVRGLAEGRETDKNFDGLRDIDQLIEIADPY